MLRQGGVFKRGYKMFNEKLKDRIEELEKENERLKSQVSLLQNENITEKYKTKALETKIRQQNEADLLFESVKIIKKLVEGEKQENLTSGLNRQRYLQQQLSASNYPNNLGGLFNVFQGI